MNVWIILEKNINLRRGRLNSQRATTDLNLPHLYSTFLIIVNQYSYCYDNLLNCSKYLPRDRHNYKKRFPPTINRRRGNISSLKNLL